MTERRQQKPEPPTPLRSNADFRSLLAATPRIHTTASTAKPAPKPTVANNNTQPQKSSKRQEHSQRYFAKQAAKQQQTKDGTTTNTAQSTNTAAHGRHQYRDRAKERRKDSGQEEREETERYSAVDEESSKFLGGDVEHTHLVKGLDVALLQRTREEDEKREQDTLDELARHITEHKQDTLVDTSKPPTFHTPLAQSVWEWLHPPPVVPSELFTRGRMTYAFPLPPRPSRFAQLPLALAATVDSREDVSALYPTLASLNELPVSVLTSRDELMDEKGNEVGGAVPPRVLQMVKAAVERKAARKSKKAKQSTDAEQTAANVGSDDDRKGTEGSEAAERKESVEEKRKRLMEQDDDDIFDDIEQPTTAAPQQQPITAHTAPAITPDAVFPSAAPNSRYFATAPQSLVDITPPTPTVPLPAHTAQLQPGLLPSASPAVEPPAPCSAAPTSSRAMVMDEEEEDEMYTSMSFSASFAGDDDSDDEAVRRQDKEEARQQRLQAKYGKGGKGKRGKGEDDERAQVERKRDAKLDRQLAGVNELLEKGSGKLTLDAFEKQSAQQQVKRLKYG